MSPSKTNSVYEKAAEGVIPSNTRANTNWCIRTLKTWLKQRNIRTAGNQECALSLDILESHDVDAVCRAMRLLVLEVRRVDGQRYPPATMRSLLSGLKRELQKAKAPLSLFDKSDRHLRELHLTLDSVSSELHKDGVGAILNSAAVITAKDENFFWETGSLGHSSPACVQNTVFFYVGLHFILRGIQEQYDLVPKQFEQTPPDISVYTTLIRITVILSMYHRTINIASRMAKFAIRRYVRMHKQAHLDVL